MPGSSWNLTALNGSAPAAGTFITLNFDNNLAVFGSDGCNNYRTTATVDGGNIEIAVNPARHPAARYRLARKFIDFVTGEQGRRIIAEYRIGGEPLFFPDAPRGR